MLSLPAEIHTEIIKMIDLLPISPRPDVRAIGRLARTCRYFRDLININSPKSMFLANPREKQRREQCMRLRARNPLDQLMIASNFFVEHQHVIYDFMTAEVYEKYKSRIGGIGVDKMEGPALLTRSPYITIEMLLEIVPDDILKSTSFQLAANSFITINELHLNGLSIDYDSSVEALSLQDCLYHKCNFNKFMISGKVNPNDVEARTDLKWLYYSLVQNPNIPLKKLLEWRKGCRFADAAISIQEIIRFTQCHSDDNIRADYEKMIIETNPPSYLTFIISKYFSFQTILDNPKYPWDWVAISFVHGTEHYIDCESKQIILPWYVDSIRFISEHDLFDDRLRYHKMFLAGQLTIEDIMQDYNKSKVWKWYTTIIATSAQYSAQSLFENIPPCFIDCFPKIFSREDVTIDDILRYPKEPAAQNKIVLQNLFNKVLN